MAIQERLSILVPVYNEAATVTAVLDRFDIEPEITAKLLLAGHEIVERPIVFQPRSHAEGKKIGWRDGIRALRVLVGYRFSGWRPASTPDTAAR